MVCVRNIICAALASSTVQAIAYNAVAKCGWTGCNYEPDLISYQQPVKASAPNEEQLISTINRITAKSQALQAPAASLTIVNGPLIIAGLGPFPQIISGFIDIVSTATTGLAAFEGVSVTQHTAGADAIFDAFRDFVRVHQALLSILIGRAGLFTTVPFVGAPVAAALRQIEAVVDTLAFLLIDVAQDRATDIQALAASLGTTVTTAIQAYAGGIL